MPYIEDDGRRAELMKNLDPRNAGELNFVLTTICRIYMEIKGERYQHYNDVIGALEGCKLEMYARKIRPYEDKKIKENGDVF